MLPGTTSADALAAVRRLSGASLAEADPHAIYRALARELLGLLPVDQVHICQPSPDGTLAGGTVYHRTDEGDTVAGDAGYLIPFERLSGVGRVRSTGEPLHVPDAASSPLVPKQLVRRFGAASLLYLPLAFEGEVRAVLLLVSETPRELSAEALELASTLAAQASTALAVSSTRSRLEARADRHAALARAAKALNARLDLNAVLGTLCREADLALGGDLSGAYLRDPQRGGVPTAAHGIPAESDWWGRDLPVGEGLAGRVLVTGEPAVAIDYQREVSPPAVDVTAAIRTAVAVPVRWGGELKGALSVGFHHPRGLAQEEIETLQAIADLAAAACGNAEAFEHANEAARRDPLTGFLNHGAIQGRLREEIERARRRSSPLSCLLLDLDDFKAVNDRHGHLVGDELLLEVAAAIQASFRPYDAIGRWGGDEFVLVLPDMGEHAAIEAAERVRIAVREAVGVLGDAALMVTASVGIATWHEPLAAAELIDRADKALLAAKARGKDALALAA